MTTTMDRPKGTTLQRSLVIGAFGLVTVFLGRLCLVPLRPVPEGPLPDALAAVAMAVGAWQFAFRMRGY